MTTAVIRWKPRSSKPSRSIAVAASAAYPWPWWSRPSAKPTSPWRSEAHLSSTSPITVPVAAHLDGEHQPLAVGDELGLGELDPQRLLGRLAVTHRPRHVAHHLRVGVEDDEVVEVVHRVRPQHEPIGRDRQPHGQPGLRSQRVVPGARGCAARRTRCPRGRRAPPRTPRRSARRRRGVAPRASSRSTSSSRERSTGERSRCDPVLDDLVLGHLRQEHRRGHRPGPHGVEQRLVVLALRPDLDEPGLAVEHHPVERGAPEVGQQVGVVAVEGDLGQSGGHVPIQARRILVACSPDGGLV